MLLLAALALLPLPQDWPHFGGPTRDNRAPATGSSYQWGEEGPKVLWRADTGPGFGGAAIVGDEVFLLDCELGESELLRVFDLAGGAEKWSLAYEAKGRVGFPGTRCVPSVTADAVYTSGAFGAATCFDRATQAIRWESHLVEVYAGEDPGFGFSCSPLVLGDVVVYAPLGSDVGLVALDKKTGEEVWVTEGIGLSHSSPTLLTFDGREQLLVLTTEVQPTGQDLAAPMSIVSVDPKDGTVAWKHTLTLTRLPVPWPVVVDAERLFVTGGYRGGSTLLRLNKKDKKGAEVAFEELFHIERGAQIHLPVLHQEHLYLIVNENANDPRPRRAEGGLLCLGLDGKERWRTGAEPYFGRGNLLLAGEHLLIQDGHDGTLSVVKTNPKAFERIATAKLFPASGERDGQMWAPMALSGKRLVLRSQEELLCVEL